MPTVTNTHVLSAPANARLFVTGRPATPVMLCNAMGVLA